MSAGAVNSLFEWGKRSLIAVVENLWDKYAVSSQELEVEREETLAELNEFLSKLGYLA